MDQQLSMFPIQDPLAGFGPPLMAYGWATSAKQLGELSRAENVGAVFVSYSQKRAKWAVDTMRSANPHASILLDACLYAGPHRSFGHRLSVDWIGYQHHTLGLPWACTNSWYVPGGSIRSLQRLFAQAAKLGPNVVLVLPLALTWMTGNLDALVELVKRYEIPIGLVLESHRDPIATKGVVTGLLRLIATEVPILLLRSDVAAVGALAFGAAASAIGTESRFRHLYPVQPPSDEDSQYGQRTSAVVGPLLTYKLLSIIERDYQRNATLPYWMCHCTTCRGRTVDWLTRANNTREAAFQHSIATLADITRTTLASLTPATQQARWRELCADAQAAHPQVLNANGNGWMANVALKRWQLETQPQRTSR